MTTNDTTPQQPADDEPSTSSKMEQVRSGSDEPHKDVQDHLVDFMKAIEDWTSKVDGSPKAADMESLHKIYDDAERRIRSEIIQAHTNHMVDKIENLSTSMWSEYYDGYNAALDQAIKIIRSQSV